VRPRIGHTDQIRPERGPDQRMFLFGHTQLGVDATLGQRRCERVLTPRLVHDHGQPCGGTREAHYLARPAQQSSQVGHPWLHRLGGEERHLPHASHTRTYVPMSR
jgi:hypothetical protein